MQFPSLLQRLLEKKQQLWKLLQPHLDRLVNTCTYAQQTVLHSITFEMFLFIDLFTYKYDVCNRSISIICPQLPTIIADNAGYDSADLVAKLRAAHTEGKKTYGLGRHSYSVSSFTHVFDRIVSCSNKREAWSLFWGMMICYFQIWPTVALETCVRWVWPSLTKSRSKCLRQQQRRLRWSSELITLSRQPRGKKPLAGWVSLLARRKVKSDNKKK